MREWNERQEKRSGRRGGQEAESDKGSRERKGKLLVMKGKSTEEN